MKVSIVAAMAKNRVIGKDNKIPWHIKEDLIHLKNLTQDHVVILGRKTFESMMVYYNKTGNPLPGKLYLVVTHDLNYKPERDNTLAVSSVEEALKKASREGQQEVFITGGQKIFEQAINLADKLYLTIIEGEFEADTFFPDYSDFKKVVFEKDGESEGYKYKFLELER